MFLYPGSSKFTKTYDQTFKQALGGISFIDHDALSYTNNNTIVPDVEDQSKPRGQGGNPVSAIWPGDPRVRPR